MVRLEFSSYLIPATRSFRGTARGPEDLDNSPLNVATINCRNLEKYVTQANFVSYKVSDIYYSLNVLVMLVFCFMQG